MEIRLPTPHNWQSFEVICQKLWKDIWSDPNTQRNVRQGQPQAGVDVFGRATYLGGKYAGVQCKDRDGRFGKHLKNTIVDQDCFNATSFTPNIEEFTVATTATRDGTVQQHERELTQKQSFPFGVHIWAWEDIEEEIRCRPLLLDAYYKGVVFAPADATRVNLSVLSQKQQCNAFFSRPEIEHRIPAGLRTYLAPLIYELSDNAFRHGHVTQYAVVCEDRAIRFEDDRAPFNPLEGLDSTKTTLHSHVGSRISRARYGKVGIGYNPHIRFDRA